MDHNPFSTMYPDELKKMRGDTAMWSKHMNVGGSIVEVATDASLPASVNWKDAGAVILSRTRVSVDHATLSDQPLSSRLPHSSMAMTFQTFLSSRSSPAVRVMETWDAMVDTNHMFSSTSPQTTRSPTHNTHTYLVMESLQVATPPMLPLALSTSPPTLRSHPKARMP
jgi:hypothetical protein